MITPTYPLQISGREMFEFNPEMVEEDDLEATDEVVYRRSESEGEEEVSDKRYLPFCVWLFCMIIIYWLMVFLRTLVLLLHLCQQPLNRR